MTRAVLLSILLTVAHSACAAEPRTANSATDAGKRTRIAELYEEARQRFPEVRGIDAVERMVRLGPTPADEAAVPVLVDVRSAEEREVSWIPGSISKKEFERRKDELAGVPVVTYCTIGYRSGVYARELQAAGWEALNLEGSILSWTHAGGELVNRDGSTRDVHVYGRRWNLAADGYRAVW